MFEKEPLTLRQAALRYLLDGEFKHFTEQGDGDWRDPTKTGSGNTSKLSLSTDGWYNHGSQEGGSIVLLAKKHGFDDGTSSDTSRIAKKLWENADYRGSSADKIREYLTRKRGIPAANYDDLIEKGLLRWNKGSERYPEPTILFPYHYLRDDKTQRSEIRKVKQTWPNKTKDRKRDLGKDGHLFVIPPLDPKNKNSDILAIEGLEDALSLRGDFKEETIVVTGGKNNFRHLERLEASGRDVTIISDHDTNERATENGQTAAAEVRTRLKDLGTNCTATMPREPKSDANDALQKGNLEQWYNSLITVPELPAPPKPKSDFYLEPWSSLKISKPNWLVKGVLECHTLAAVIGESGSGKSFIVVDIACCIATGTPWHGRDIQQGTVVYLVGEGKSGLKRRISAWEHHQGIKPERLLLSSKAIDLGDRGRELPKVQAALRELPEPPVLIVIDTLARHSTGAEASNEEMSAFISNLDALKDEFKTTVVVVHHVGKDPTKGARGPSAFRAALDHELLTVKPDTGVINLTCEKSKDAEPFVPMGFKLQAADVFDEQGRPLADDDGSAIKSCILQECEPTQPTKEQTLTGKQQQARDIFFELRKKSENGVVTRANWYKRLEVDGITPHDKTKKALKDKMVEIGLFVVCDEGSKEEYFTTLNQPNSELFKF
jgi:KaiC/GvpD/RAD55 family RecA-like ATPase